VSGGEIIREAGGRFGPGTKAGPGRPKLPAWLTESAGELLKLQYNAAMHGEMPVGDPRLVPEGELQQTEPVPTRTRAAIAESLLDRICGRAREAEGDAQDGVASVLASLTAKVKP
jgi:hypothetical protein